MNYCVCSHPESAHEPNGEIRKYKTPPCTICRKCSHFVAQSTQGRLYSDAELTALADATIRLYQWRENQMSLKEQRKIERMKKAYRRKRFIT